jgi:hypothetical protein
MGRAQQYMSLPSDVRARASSETSPVLKAEWENLAVTYVRLAEQSEDHSVGPTYDPIWNILEHSRH